MSHPEPSSRSLDFFLDLGNLTTSVNGTVLDPPLTQEWWASQGVGTHYGIEFTVNNAFRAGVDEEGTTQADIYWDDTVLGLENGPSPLFGFKISYKGYQEVITYDSFTDTWYGTRTYPQTTNVSAVLSNPQRLVPTLWPITINTPEEIAWRNLIFDNREVQWSTAIVPRRFEGITLYGCDKPVVSGEDPGVVGIAEGHARCLGFIESNTNLSVNFVAPGDYYIEANTLQAYMRTPDDNIEPLITTNEGATGPLIPMEGGGFAGRIDHPDELPRSTEDNPIPIGTTYLQRRDPEIPLPFPGFIGTDTWSFVDIPLADPDSPEGLPIRDRNGDPIEDFRWQRSQRPEAVSGYNYVLVFDQATFEYVQRLAGPFTEQIHIVRPALTGQWFPTEPWDTEAEPPIYPIDTIPAFVPDSRETIDVEYTLVVSGDVIGNVRSRTIKVNQTCIAPTRDWGKMLVALLARCYYTHDIPRSYADVPGYCNPESPQFGDNFTDPECLEDRGGLPLPWIDPETGQPIPIAEIRAANEARRLAEIEAEKQL